MKKNNRIAVFDLDGTITDKDTYLEFIKFAKGSVKFYLGLMLLSPRIIAFYLKWISNNQLKLAFFQYFFGTTEVSDLRKSGTQFAFNRIPDMVRSGAQQVLRWHLDRGHEVLILTASSDLWVGKWCEMNNFQLISTKFQAVDNKFTGAFEGSNCFGPEKKKLLLEFFRDKEYYFTYGYGDSAADSYFLELVDQSFLMPLSSENVNRKWVPEIKGE